MREPREKEEDAVYTVGAKTNNNEMFFEIFPGSKELMMEYIEKAHEKFDFGWCFKKYDVLIHIRC